MKGEEPKKRAQEGSRHGIGRPGLRLTRCADAARARSGWGRAG